VHSGSYPLLPRRLARGNKVIAELNDCNYHKCRHGWSEQEIHKSSFPK
jgi:hypothetical protein